MHEYKEGKLHSGSKKGPMVTNPKQAVAIAYSEAKKSKKKDPKPKHHHMKTSIKKDGYEIHHGKEVRDMMEDHMHKAAGIKRRGEKYSDDLDYAKDKPSTEHFDECQEKDSKMAYRKAGLNKKSGADNDKESMEESRKIGIKTKKKRK